MTESLALSIPTALLGAVMGVVVLAAAMLYARTLSAAPSALNWWAAAFACQALGLAAQFPDPLAAGRPVLWFAMAAQAAGAVLVLLGVIEFLNRRVRTELVGLGIAFIFAWPFVALVIGPETVPGIAGVPLLVAAVAFLARRPAPGGSGHATGHGPAALSFGLWGALDLVRPLIGASLPALFPWTYVGDQVLAIATAISLMVVVLRRQQFEAEQETLRANQTHARFVDAIESISEGFVLWDETDRLVMHNTKYKELLSGLADLIRPGVAFNELATAAAERGMVTEAAGRETNWLAERIEAHSNPQHAFEQTLDDGRVILSREYRTHEGGLVAIRTDITERKRFEQALQESEQRFKDLAEAASDWFWETGPDLRFTFVSSRVRQVLAVRTSFFIGKTFADLGEAVDTDPLWRDQLEVMANGRPFRDFVFEQRLPDGTIKCLRMSGRPMYDQAGRFKGYRGTATDITELRRHQADLASLAERLQLIMDHMPMGITVYDRDLTLVAMNRTHRLMFDLPEALATAGTPLVDVIGHLARRGEYGADGTIEQLSARRLESLTDLSTDSVEWERPDGSTVEIRRAPMPAGGFLATYADVTGRKRVERDILEAKEAAERGNRSKAAFLASMSHELRTPLNAIIGFSEAMMSQIFGPLGSDHYQSYLTDIHDSGIHLLKLINEILDMSKAEAGHIDLHDTEIDTGELVRGCMRMVRDKASGMGVGIHSHLPDDLPTLNVDERRFKQIVLNLLSNAVKFTDEGGSVTVLAGLEPDGAFALRISDTGIGMSEDDIAKAMEPFAQVDSRLERKYEGTGLGLPLTKALVEGHGGTLTLESTFGQGTVAVVRMPPDRVIPRGA